MHMKPPREYGKSTVLMIDDDPMTPEICSKLLRTQGYSTHWLPNGERALQQLHRIRPDLILLDIIMPGMDGYETCKALKRDVYSKDVPIIFMSALTEPVDKVKAFSLGGVDFISKPIESQELLARVQTQLTLASLQQELKEINTNLELRIAARSRDLYKINETLIAEIEERKKTEKALKMSRQQLRALYLQLAHVEEAERQRLARELHDQVGQNLTALGITLNVVLAQLSEESKSKVKARLQDANRITTETACSIRDVMAALRPQVLDDYGLKAALQMEAERFSARTGISAEVIGSNILPRPTEEVETAFFRIAQEALTNVSKHSRAKQVIIRLENVGNSINLSLMDDGIGFDSDQLSTSPRSGWGLMTMRERIEAHNGSLHIESKPGQGTRIIVEATR